MVINLNKKSKKLITILKVFFGLTLIISLTAIIKWYIQKKDLISKINYISEISKTSESINSENDEIIEQLLPIPKDNPYWNYINFNLLDIDFSELKKINNEVIGYLKIPGTEINYPFMQHSNNEYYLSHSFDNSYNNAGWIFMDYRNKISDFDKNTILYGHRMYDKTMFSTLKNVLTDEWLENKDNHVVYISTEYESSLWQIFSIYYLPNTTDYLQTSFLDETDFQNFIDMINNRSEYNFDSSPTINDKILTLSTCYNTNQEKLVVHAKLIKRKTSI